MSSREEILNRLKKAAPATSSVDLPRLSHRSIFHDYPQDESKLLACFEQRFATLKGEFFRVDDIHAAAKVLRDIIRSAEEGPIVAQPEPLVDKVLGYVPELQGRLEEASVLEGDSLSFSSCILAISAAHCLVARTGSIFVHSALCGGRRLSVLPPFHVVIARSNQLVFSLEDALLSVEEHQDSSYVGIINGPSRTADIEKILVMGAHGPKRLAVILVES